MTAQLTPYHEVLLSELKTMYRLSARPMTAAVLAQHLGQSRKTITVYLRHLQAVGCVARPYGRFRGYIPCTDNPELARMTVEDYLLYKVEYLSKQQGYGVTRARLAAHMGMSESATCRYLQQLERKGLIARPDGWDKGYIVVNGAV